MIILETNRLVLRTMEIDDLDAMTAINQDHTVMEYFPALQNKEQTLTFIKKQIQQQNEFGFSLYAVELKSTHEMIGFVGLNQVDFETPFTPAVEIGWRLASAHWNQGYATEAANAVLHYAFNKLMLKEIVSFTSVNNMRSRHVMEKIDLQHNPTEDFDHPKLEKSHSLCRHVLYRISKTDYQKAHT